MYGNSWLKYSEIARHWMASIRDEYKSGNLWQLELGSDCISHMNESGQRAGSYAERQLNPMLDDIFILCWMTAWSYAGWQRDPMRDNSWRRLDSMMDESLILCWMIDLSYAGRRLVSLMVQEHWWPVSYAWSGMGGIFTILNRQQCCSNGSRISVFGAYFAGINLS